MNDEVNLLPIKLQRYMEMMTSESDRGSVLVCAAILDDTLGEMIQAKLVPSPKNNDELLSSAFAPLGSFSSKIEMSYRLGLIRRDVYKSLTLLRKIRNDFAHASVKNGFDEQSTQQKIMDMVGCNKEVVDAIVDAVAVEKGNPSFDLSKLIEITSWRFLLEIIFSSMAAALSEQVSYIESISELE